jgi:glyoxylase-like metal-dependent hydrolase (beta-lactamase superfamily II)/rhodanese-related sulfurtransferase
MIIQQFEDVQLSHFGYAIVSEGHMVVIDPARNPQPYYDFAAAHNATIVAVIETHPHADFVSSHLEMSQATGAPIYVSALLGAAYTHTPFDEPQSITFGNATLRALNTPGHSADSLTLVMADARGKDVAVFSGDTLFIGDCGRPDLREAVGNVQAERTVQARQMFQSLKKYLVLADDVLVYPAHGAGSLCGKGLSSALSSTIGAEKLTNWSLIETDEEAFVMRLTDGQPFVPAYFPYDVELNRHGAPAYAPSVNAVTFREPINCMGCVGTLDPGIVVVDTRAEASFKVQHVSNSINIPDAKSFETWLGSVIQPGEKFYLAAASHEKLLELIGRIAKIGYEAQIVMGFVVNYGNKAMPRLDVPTFETSGAGYTIIDVRNHDEAQQKIFDSAIHIPLHQLRQRIAEVPTDKPIVVHCAGGYRSAVGSSILKNAIDEQVQVFDLSTAVNDFKQQVPVS